MLVQILTNLWCGQDLTQALDLTDDKLIYWVLIPAHSLYSLYVSEGYFAHLQNHNTVIFTVKQPQEITNGQVSRVVVIVTISSISLLVLISICHLGFSSHMSADPLLEIFRSFAFFFPPTVQAKPKKSFSLYH